MNAYPSPILQCVCVCVYTVNKQFDQKIMINKITFMRGKQV